MLYWLAGSHLSTNFKKKSYQHLGQRALHLHMDFQKLLFFFSYFLIFPIVKFHKCQMKNGILSTHLCCECLITNGAFERTFLGVTAIMNFKCWLTGECFEANFACSITANTWKKKQKTNIIINIHVNWATSFLKLFEPYCVKLRMVYVTTEPIKIGARFLWQLSKLLLKSKTKKKIF